MQVGILVAPNGVGVDPDVVQKLPSAGILWSMVNVVGALVRGVIPDPNKQVTIETTIARADDVAVVWAVGPFILHGSDLRAGTISQFIDMIGKARAKGIIAERLQTGSAFVLGALAADEGIPVGIIVQQTTFPPVRPVLDVRLPNDVHSMWLASVRLGLAQRLGEQGYQELLASVATLRRQHADNAAFWTALPPAMQQRGSMDDEGYAATVLADWERTDGGQTIAKLRALAPS